jgi:SAM-dependent methyltransferase
VDQRTYWDSIYRSKPETDVSWFQGEPRVSLELIREFCPQPGDVIDVGGGASVLVDRLLDAGYRPAVLDLSKAALEKSQARLGARSGQVRWLVADVTEAADAGSFDIWHDRAVFHFLTAPADRSKYAELAARTVRTGGHLILGTFSLEGPTRCSGLDVQRHGAASLSAELRDAFELVREMDETHTTPQGKPQRFFWGVFRRVG